MKHFCLAGLLLLLNVFSQSLAEILPSDSILNQENDKNSSALIIDSLGSEKLNHPLPVDRAFELS